MAAPTNTERRRGQSTIRQGLSFVVEGIFNRTLRRKVRTAVAVCDRAVRTLDAVDVHKHETTLIRKSTGSAWDELSPQVQDAACKVRDAAQKLGELFESASYEDASDEIDFDAAFAAFAEGPDEDAGALDFAFEADAIVHREQKDPDPETALSDQISALAGMLHSELVQFSKLMKMQRAMEDRWFLLAGVDEFRGKCTQCFEAILASIAHTFGDQRIEELLPRYRTASQRAATVRKGVTDLSYDLAEARTSCSHLGDEGASACIALFDGMLNAFRSSDAYALLRPVDKEQVVEFRRFLKGCTQGKELNRLEEELEGFSKFLEVLTTINRRPELIRHDKECLEKAQAVLGTKTSVSYVVEMLEPAYGRGAEIDAWIRSARAGELETPSRERVVEVVDAMLSQLSM